MIPLDVMRFRLAGQKEKAASREKSGLLDIWRPRADDYDNWEIYYDFYKIRQL